MALVPRGKLWVLVFWVCVYLGAPSWSLAQGEAGQAAPATSPGSSGRFTCPVVTGPILVSGSLPMGKGNFAIQPFWYLTLRGSKFDDGWRTVRAGQLSPIPRSVRPATGATPTAPTWPSPCVASIRKRWRSWRNWSHLPRRAPCPPGATCDNAAHPGQPRLCARCAGGWLPFFCRLPHHTLD